MSCIVARTCTEVRQVDTEHGEGVRSRPISAFRAASAYVLLGDPGSGKSTSFGAECDALGDEACAVHQRHVTSLVARSRCAFRGVSWNGT